MEASAMNITTVGIDLAKNALQVHAVDARGKVVLRKQFKRIEVSAFFANLPPCLIGMEACGGAHYWGRTLEQFGHTVRLIPPQFVKPYVKSNKNDVADAEAICEAGTSHRLSSRPRARHRVDARHGLARSKRQREHRYVMPVDGARSSLLSWIAE
jgi:transposase